MSSAFRRVPRQHDTRSNAITESPPTAPKHRLIELLPKGTVLDRNEKLMMQIDWNVPASMRLGQGSKGEKTSASASIPDPPLHVYANSNDWKANLKNIRAWPRKNKAQIQKEMDIYGSLTLSDVFLYRRNIEVMIAQQELLFRSKLPNGDQLPLFYRIIDQNESPRAVTPDMNEEETPIHRPIAIRPVNSYTNASSMNTSNASNASNIDDDANGSANANAKRSHAYTGAFDMIEQVPKKRKSGRDRGHAAVTKVKDSFFSLLSKFTSFARNCTSPADGKWELNDVVIIHCQNVQWTKSRQLDACNDSQRKMIPFDGNVNRVTVFGRSEALIKRIINLVGLGIREDERVKFKLVHGNETESLDSALENFKTEINEERV